MNDLQIYTQEMENELDTWKKEVHSVRKKYYELNYYTTVQLLILRRELGAFKIHKQKSVISPDVLALLQSVSCQITGDNACGVIRDFILRQLDKNHLRNEPSAEPVQEQPVETKKETDSVSACAPPTLTESKLTAEQLEISAYIIKEINCSQSLVLKAFEECNEKEMSRYEYLRWCNDNLENYQYPSRDGVSDEESSEYGSECSDAELEHSSFSQGTHKMFLQ